MGCVCEWPAAELPSTPHERDVSNGMKNTNAAKAPTKVQRSSTPTQIESNIAVSTNVLKWKGCSQTARIAFHERKKRGPIGKC